AAIVVSVEFCILVGVLLSFLFYVPKAARIHVTQLVVAGQRTVRERLDSDPVCPRLRIENFEGELFFGASPAFEEALERIEEEALPDQVVILRLRYVRNLDAVCLHVLHDFLTRMQQAKRVVLLSGVRDDAYVALKNVGIVDDIGEDHIFREVPQLWSSTFAAIQAAYDRIGTGRCDRCPRQSGPVEPADDWTFVI
ncbi:MAG: STAS domain-containing protein, partial [Aureliella sp.]